MDLEQSQDLVRLVEAGVDHTLTLARTWLVWDGQPRISDGGDRVYTPHKALRRYVDHFIDHLAQIESLVARQASVEDEWHGSLVTFDSDWARFTETDLQEATQRLLRMAHIYRLRLEGLTAAAWDRRPENDWTIREIVEHVADPWYANQVGDLSGG